MSEPISEPMPAALAKRRQPQHDACMPTSVTIRDVPDDVHEELSVRAARAGQSLQAFLLATLTERARRPSKAEVLARIEQNRRRSASTVTAEHILAALDEVRGRP